METDQQFSRTVMHQIGLNIIEHHGADALNRPGDVIATAMLAYRADPKFWDQHLEAGIGGDRMAAEQAKVDGITMEFRNAVKKAHAKRTGGQHG
jgi:hypothetical protein